MGPYNSFSGELRAEAQRWLNMMVACGKLVRPKVCMACGQDQGPIDMHAEDYSKPFALRKTDEFHLCFSCHLACHCRFKNPGAWDHYRDQIARGWRYPAIGRNFPLFIRRFNGGSFLDTALEFDAQPRTAFPLNVIDTWLLDHTGKGWR